MVTLGYYVLCFLRLLLAAAATALAPLLRLRWVRRGATLLSPFPGEGRPGVKVGLRARAAQ